MLGTPEIETMRAALLYWQDEMSPHSEETWRAYFDRADVQPLSGAGISQLRTELATCIRYAVYDPVNEQLLNTTLWITPEEAIVQGGHPAVATVFAPPSAAS